MRRSGAPLAVALAAFFVVVQFYTSLAALSPTPPVGYVFATPRVAAALVATLVAATVVALWRLWRDREPVPRTSRAMLAAWIGSAAVSSALGLDPRAGFEVVGMMVLAAVFHLAVVRYFTAPGVAPLLLGAYLTAGLVASLAGLAMSLTHHPAALWALNHGRAAGPFVTANQFASFLIAFAYVALGVALGGAGPLRRLAWSGVVSAGMALALTVSLAGWLGAAAAGVFFAFALGAKRASAALGVLALVVAAVGLVRPAAGHNPAESFDRLRIWRSGVRVAELFPLTGTGPMAYWRVYPEIALPSGDAPGTFGALHPHDVYLSLAGETGALGLATFAYGWFRFIRRMRGALRVCPKRARCLAAGTCAALVAVLVQGLFDTVGIVEMTFVWIPYTALALAAARADTPRAAHA